jgi:hypothetical protein
MEKITMVEYQKKMDKIIKENSKKSVSEVLMLMLEEASKYEIKEEK